jgi:glycosyltransferase involved in cell wall biosynthesis
MKSILLITYEFPPTWTPQAKRWHSLLKAIGERSAHKLEVLTASLGPRYIPGQSGPGQEAGLEPRVHVMQTRPGPVAEHLYQRPINSLSYAPLGVQSSPIGSALKGLMKRLLPLDKSAEWLFWSFEALKKTVDIRSYDVVITSGPPHATHAWGYAIKRLYGVKWIADLGDPFSFACDNRALPPVRALQRGLERAAFLNADRVVVTTEATRAKYSDMYPFAADRLLAIPQGADVERYSIAPWRPEPGRLVYIGSFYRNVREPDELIGAIAHLNGRASLHVIGPLYKPAISQVVRTPGLNRLIFFHGFQPEEYCIDQMSRAECLVFLSNGLTTQIPGKLYEYLATGLPILAVMMASTDDACLPLLRNWPQVRMTENAAVEIADAICLLRQRPAPAPCGFDCGTARCELSWEGRAEDYLRVIDAATGAQGLPQGTFRNLQPECPPLY